MANPTPIRVPISAFRQYDREMRKLVLQPFFRNLSRGLRQAKATNDAWYALNDAGLTRAHWDEAVAAGVARQAKAVEAYHRRKLIRSFRASLQVDISGTLSEEAIQFWMDAWRKENIALIKTIPERAHEGLNRRMTELFRDKPFDQSLLMKALNTEFKSSGYNLRRLTRDQTNKAIGQLTELRQTELGIEEYIWRTSGDERVREEHVALHGTRQRWSRAPSEGHPGHAIQCRCVAEAVIDRRRARTIARSETRQQRKQQQATKMPSAARIIRWPTGLRSKANDLDASMQEVRNLRALLDEGRDRAGELTRAQRKFERTRDELGAMLDKYLATLSGQEYEVVDDLNKLIRITMTPRTSKPNQIGRMFDDVSIPTRLLDDQPHLQNWTVDGLPPPSGYGRGKAHMVPEDDIRSVARGLEEFLDEDLIADVQRYHEGHPLRYSLTYADNTPGALDTWDNTLNDYVGARWMLISNKEREGVPLTEAERLFAKKLEAYMRPLAEEGTTPPPVLFRVEPNVKQFAEGEMGTLATFSSAAMEPKTPFGMGALRRPSPRGATVFEVHPLGSTRGAILNSSQTEVILGRNQNYVVERVYRNVPLPGEREVGKIDQYVVIRMLPDDIDDAVKVADKAIPTRRTLAAARQDRAPQLPSAPPPKLWTATGNPPPSGLGTTRKTSSGSVSIELSRLMDQGPVDASLDHYRAAYRKSSLADGGMNSYYKHNVSINQKMRDGEALTATEKRAYKELLSSMDSMDDVYDDIPVLYRGGVDDARYKPGDTFAFTQPTYTSSDATVAADFSRVSGNSIIYEIHANADTRAAFESAAFQTHILPRGEAFEVEKVFRNVTIADARRPGKRRTIRQYVVLRLKGDAGEIKGRGGGTIPIKSLPTPTRAPDVTPPKTPVRRVRKKPEPKPPPEPPKKSKPRKRARKKPRPNLRQNPR